jgi:hypothetical protein
MTINTTFIKNNYSSFYKKFIKITQKVVVFDGHLFISSGIFGDILHAGVIC